ncbi:hypothetical protein FRB90_004684, partial [Tulasnella sp. 427]
VELSLHRAIGTWQTLQHLVLPEFYLTPSILQATASLLHLVTLSQGYSHKGGYEAAGILRDLSGHAFPAIEGFAFNCELASAIQLNRQSGGLFSRLKGIHINTSNGVDNAGVAEFARYLGQECRQLESIAMDLFLPLRFRAEIIPALSVEVLEGIFPCRALRMLSIGHPLPIVIQAADVERAAAAWPGLVVLSITVDPDLSLPIPDDIGNSWLTLSAFAQHLPRMQQLGLYFAKADIITFTGDLYPPYEFQDLKRLQY